MKQKVLVTAALLYANGSVHFGHLAGAYLPADIYTRFLRLSGDDVLYICGSDEYGMAITMSAELAGRTPKEQVDYFHEINQKLFKRLNISFDHYSRTTCKEHAPIVQEFFLTLLKNGYIEKKTVQQLYSKEEGRFLADRYVVGTCPKCRAAEARGDECPKCGGSFEATDLINPVSKLTRSKLELKDTSHWFLRLDLFKDQLRKWLNTRDWKPNVINFIKPYLEELKPRAITRDLNWGIPVPLPDAEGKVLYVWFDAPIGYISATQEWAHQNGKTDTWKNYWCDPNTKYVEFIGKDNIVFHALFFPSMLMGQDTQYKLVDALPANEFLNLEGKQFSKSTGWYIDLADFLDKFPLDTLRYTLSANAPENQDSEFTYADFQQRVNTELVGKFGNFIHRTLTFIATKMDQKIPEVHGFDDLDNDFLAQIQEHVQLAKDHYRSFRVRKVCVSLMEMASLANTYFDAKKPWNLIKNKDNQEDLETTMYCCLTAIKAMALIAYPIIPDTAEKIWRMLGFEHSIATCELDTALNEELIPLRPLPKPMILFDKIEDEIIQKEVMKLTATTANPVQTKELISYDDFSKLDLRVGKILTAEPVPKSKRLLKLTVDLGSEQRTIVSGISEHFPDPQTLQGAKVIVVANLKPVKLMGVESFGMILAATKEGLLELPMLKEMPEGSTVS